MDRETIIGIKDLDRHLAKYVDDKDVLNMIINKKYLELFDEDFFRNLLMLKYPLLVKFKKDETWKEFYIKMVYYLAKLKEEFDFPYIPSKTYNPITIYRHFQEKPQMVGHIGLMFAAEIGDMKLMEEMLSKGGDLTYGLMGAAKKGDKTLVDYFIALGTHNLNGGLVYAAECSHKDLVDYFISLGVSPKYAVIGAATSRDDDMFNYIISKYPVNLNHALFDADVYSIRYLIKKGATDLNGALRRYAQKGNLKAVKLLISQGATNIENARNNALANRHTPVVEYLNTLLN